MGEYQTALCICSLCACMHVYGYMDILINPYFDITIFLYIHIWIYSDPPHRKGISWSFCLFCLCHAQGTPSGCGSGSGHRFSGFGAGSAFPSPFTSLSHPGYPLSLFISSLASNSKSKWVGGPDADLTSCIYIFMCFVSRSFECI